LTKLRTKKPATTTATGKPEEKKVEAKDTKAPT